MDDFSLGTLSLALIVLLVTSPSPKGERYGQGHRELIATLPPEQDALVTTRMRRTAARPLPSGLIPNAERVMDSLKHVPTAVGFQASATPGIRRNTPIGAASSSGSTRSKAMSGSSAGRSTSTS